MNKIEQYKLDIETFGCFSLIQQLLDDLKLPNSFCDERNKTGDANILFRMIDLLCDRLSIRSHHVFTSHYLPIQKSENTLLRISSGEFLP